MLLAFVSRYEHLTENERQLLLAHPQITAQPLLERYARWRQAHPKRVRYGFGDSRSRQQLFKDLTAMVAYEDTEAVLNAIQTLGLNTGLAEREPMELLESRCDPAVYLPALAAMYERVPADQREKCWLRENFTRAAHPAVVAFLSKVLLDPASPDQWRAEALLRLPLTGGASGRELIKRIRATPKSRKPWTASIRFDWIYKDHKSLIHRDSRGRQWMVFRSDVLGNGSDLFLVEQTQEGLGAPCLLPSALGSQILKEQKKNLSLGERPLTLEQRLKPGWLNTVFSTKGLWRDTDYDGLDDNVEARLGTNPNREDSDKDGIWDAVDACPLTPPRPLNEQEKILEVALGARFAGESFQSPMLISIPDIRPFQAEGFPGHLFWVEDSERTKHPLKDFIGDGVQTMELESPAADAQPWWLAYRDGGSTALVSFHRWSGVLNADGFEVTLKKFDGEWYAVEVVLLWIS